MKFFSKVVTALLLVVLGAVPVLAAVPYQEEMHSSMCCKPGCSMMAAKETSGAQFRIKSVAPTRCSCKLFPVAPALTSIAPAQRISREVALVADPVAGVAAIATLRVLENHTPPDRQSRVRSQSILCTFLI